MSLLLIINIHIHDCHDKLDAVVVYVATSRECRLDQHMVKTFDGLTLPFTSPTNNVANADCELLITQDCSSSAHFAVLASGPPAAWKLRLLVSGSEIEWIWREGSPMIKVDGEERNIGSSRPIIIRKEPTDVRYVEQFYTKLNAKNNLLCVKHVYCIVLTSDVQLLFFSEVLLMIT